MPSQFPSGVVAKVVMVLSVKSRALMGALLPQATKTRRLLASSYTIPLGVVVVLLDNNVVTGLAKSVKSIW